MRHLVPSILKAIALSATCVMVLGAARAELPPLINLALENPDVSVTGAANGDRSGFSLTAGDVNGDGRDDLIVLSYWAHWVMPAGGERTGEIDIIWGQTFPNQGDLPLSQDSPAFSRVFGTDTQAYNSVISGGDFNADGKFDIIWGQPHGPAQDFSSGDGIVFVILGSSTFPDTLDIGANPSQVITLLGAQWSRGHLGMGNCGCDLNGDGFDEIVVAAPVSAEVFIIWGGATFSSVYDMSQTPEGVTRISDTISYTELGRSLGCADFDEDGFEDLVMSSSVSPDSRRVTTLFGRSEFPDSIAFPNVDDRMTRIYADALVGSSIAIGDLNGDGQLDLALDDANADPLGCRDCGETYVILDAAALPDSIWLEETQPLRVLGTGKYTYYGTELQLADLTGDGMDELIVVGQGNYSSPTSIDQTVVVYGSTTPEDTVYIATDPTLTRIRGPSHGVGLGQGITSSDFNGDGVIDLALGAPYFQGNSGRTYVFFGCNTVSDTNSAAPPRFALRQNYPNPFNPQTTIEYAISGSARVRVSIYDVGGRRILTLVDEEQRAGAHVARWDGRDEQGQPVASGVYFCQLVAGQQSASMKLVLLR